MTLRMLTPFLLSTLALASPAFAQEEGTPTETYLVRVTPDEVLLPLGESVELKAEVVDAGGRPVEKSKVFFFSRSRRSVNVTREGKLTARKAGEFSVIARALIPGVTKNAPSAEVKVTVPQPKPESIEFGDDIPSIVYTQTTTRLPVTVMGENDIERTDLQPEITSSDPALADVDQFGFLNATKPGKVTLTAKAEGITSTHDLEIKANPVAQLKLTAAEVEVRTGDVVQFETTLLDQDGKELSDVPVQFSFIAAPDDNLGPAATGQIEQDGRFVAEAPGLYTIVATCGSTTAKQVIKATQRFESQKKIEVVGRGKVHDSHTSDLWVWEGVDGRDYAVTGTWGANGEAHFWDVTDPANIERISTVKVDARTVNDVKVSQDGKICVISREGASDRKNGIVMYNVEDPKNPKEITSFDDELTGGVHNVFVDGNHVYALSASRRYDILNIDKPEEPSKVGSYQIFEPGAAIHDVWVADGIAYSSNWKYGVHMVDVGYGIAGGSPSDPKFIASCTYPNGKNHAAFPYRSPQTGKFYVVAGDESFPFGLSTKNKPTYPRGWIHFLDFTDLKAPKEVARYQVPEAGTHNMWIEDDIMYVAYYNGGLRVVDISGDLMGDLYNQGREIAWFLPTDDEGYIPNAPMVWGPQPHKGHIFFSDWNTGLWAVKMVEGNKR